MDSNNSGSPGTALGTDPTRSPQNRIPPPHGYALSGKIMLAAIVVLFTIVLLILFVHLYVRWRVYRRNSRILRRIRRRQRNPLVFASGDPAAPASARGLDPKVLRSLPVLIFSDDDEEDGGDVPADCAVCLNEFEEGEKVRVLPRCAHRFHIECIDMWFGSHNSCPLCRSAVEIESPPPPPAAAADLSCADRTSESSSDSTSQEVSIEIRSIEDSQIEESASHAKSRISAIKRFLCGDLRLDRGERDLERGEAPEGDPPAPVAE